MEKLTEQELANLSEEERSAIEVTVEGEPPQEDGGANAEAADVDGKASNTDR